MSLLGFLRPKTVPFQNLNLRKDFHCHLLPGVDDGVQKLEDTVRILKDMKEAGFTSVTLTPHINPDIFPDNTEEFIRTRFEMLQGVLPPELSSSMSISLGAEYMVTEGFEERDVSDLIRFCDGRVLIEMSYFYPSRNFSDAIFHLTMEGLTPVVAHPERYLYLSGTLSEFDRWYDMGAGYQLNLLSLKGVYGPASVRIMEYLLKRGMYVMAGTDTHTVKHFQNIAGMELPKHRFDLLYPLLQQNRL